VELFLLLNLVHPLYTSLDVLHGGQKVAMTKTKISTLANVISAVCLVVLVSKTLKDEVATK
jgi:hypothetical protein